MRRRMNKLHFGLTALTALVALAACGGSVVDQTTGGAGTGAATPGNSTGNSTTGAGGSTTEGPCPVAPPSAGSSCAGVPNQFRSTYGVTVRPECRAAWVCDSGAWSSTSGDCLEPPPGECVTTEPGPETVCANMGDVCTYGPAICQCGCGGGLDCAPPVDWQCSGPPTTGVLA